MSSARSHAEEAPAGALGAERAPEPAAVTQPTEEQRLRAASTGSVSVVASDTFGWIHPEVAEQPLTRRALREPHTHLAAVAIALAGVGLVVSWFGPWGAVPALVALVIGIVARLRKSERKSRARWAIGIALTAIAFSAYWLTWILPRLGAPGA